MLARLRLPDKQRGVTLVITLIVLVAMTLAGIALTRSVDTNSLIAGNLAFQQTATPSGEAGIEQAIAWLQGNNTGNTLYASNLPMGYSAVRQDPNAAIQQSWDDYWTNVILPAQQFVTILPVPDAAGNTVSYTIHRLCKGPNAAGGAPGSIGVGCASPPASNATGSSMGAGAIAFQTSTQVYYRITVRIAGPRSTVSYIQAIVAM